MKDSRWLTLEVCRQYQRKLCSRDENDCKFAHPPPHVDVQNGRVICCYDSIKGKCQRRDPPCKYFHPPQHLRELLLQNGRTNLILKSMQLQLLQQQFAAQSCQMMSSPSASALSVAAAAAAAAAAVAAAGSPQGTPSGTPGPAGTPQCPTPGSPASSTGKLMYPTAPPLNLTPPGMATAYSILLSQQAVEQHKTAVTDISGANGLDVATTKLAQVFNTPKASDFAQTCMYPGGLYLSAMDAAVGNATRKRSASYIVEPSYAALYQGVPTILGYSQQFEAQFLAAQSAAAASQMGVGLSPYLTPAQLNSMAAATASALKAVPPAVSLANGNGLSAAHLAVMATNGIAAPGTPAKRPALADGHSGMPMFDCGRGLFTLQPPQPVITTMTHPIRQQHQQPPQQQTTQQATRSTADSSVVSKRENGEATEASATSDGQPTPTAATAVAQYYPETYIEIPQYGYP